MTKCEWEKQRYKEGNKDKKESNGGAGGANT
jgi:hypothetical protein